MNAEDWCYDAVERAGARGATLRHVQRTIDDLHHEELAIDTIATALARLVARGRLLHHDDRWRVAHRTGKDKAAAILFRDD